MKEAELTIGIATCGRHRLLRRCINSIRKYTRIPFELVIVDNTKAFKPDYKPPFVHRAKYIEVSDKKIGCCETNNIILDNCSTEYLMYMDDDVYVRDDGTIEYLFKNLKRLEKKERRVAIGGSWYDTFYKSFRHGSVRYLYLYNNVWYIKKLLIDYKIVESWGCELVETDELLHSFIVNVESLRNDDIKWDNNFKWKGDRFDFFLQMKKKNWRLFQAIKYPFIHDPQPLPYGSLSYEFDGAQAINYFKEKWNVIPLVAWDKYQVKPK